MAGEDVLYKPGISFTNPRLVKISAPVRSNPWFFEEKGVGPLSASSKLRRWDGNTPLKTYKAVWDRNAKQRNMIRLGDHYNSMPTMQELGAAPPATSETPSTVRTATGFLENLISFAGQAATGVTDVLTQRAVQQRAAAASQSQSYLARMGTTFGGSDSSMMWILGAGVIGLGAFYFLRRK